MALKTTLDPAAQKARAVLGGSAVLPSGRPSDSIGKSNLDLTGRRIVKRGVWISWGGLRMKVSRVRMGKLKTVSGVDHWLSCRSVQVVA